MNIITFNFISLPLEAEIPDETVRLHANMFVTFEALTCKQAQQTAGSSQWFFSLQEKAQLLKVRKDSTLCWGT